MKLIFSTFACYCVNCNKYLSMSNETLSSQLFSPLCKNETDVAYVDNTRCCLCLVHPLFYSFLFCCIS